MEKEYFHWAFLRNQEKFNVSIDFAYSGITADSSELLSDLLESIKIIPFYELSERLTDHIRNGCDLWEKSRNDHRLETPAVIPGSEWFERKYRDSFSISDRLYNFISKKYKIPF